MAQRKKFSAISGVRKIAEGCTYTFRDYTAHHHAQSLRDGVEILDGVSDKISKILAETEMRKVVAIAANP
jgi:hypothetical protein